MNPRPVQKPGETVSAKTVEIARTASATVAEVTANAQHGVESLIVKGHPPEFVPRKTNRLVWFGAALFGLALAVFVARFKLTRGANAFGGGPADEDLRLPPELKMREPSRVPLESFPEA